MDIILGILIVIPLRYLNLYPSLFEFEFTPIITFKVIILFPIIEELIFRLPLRISKINILTSFCLIIFLNLNKWCISNMLLAFLCCSILFFALHFWTRKDLSFLNKLTSYLSHHFRGFFYFLALTFGFLHLTNYNIDLRYFYLLPLIALSYIITGCILGYLCVRFKNGIFLCITSHILVNLIYYLLMVP